MTDEATLEAASELASGILRLVAGVTEQHRGDPDCNVIIVSAFVEVLCAMQDAMPRDNANEPFVKSVFSILRKLQAN